MKAGQPVASGTAGGARLNFFLTARHEHWPVWVLTGFLAASFPLMAVVSGAYPFIFFSAIMALQFLVVLVLFPETISLEPMRHKLELA